MNDLVHWKIPIREPFLFGSIIIQSFPQLRGTAIDHCSTYLTIASAVLCCVLLYIPLCFYFIEGCRLVVETQKHFTFHYASTLSDAWTICPLPMYTLHSIMLLLYQAAAQHLIRSLQDLYIPLCFYFILFMRLDSASMASLYIPLCFYFIAERRLDNLYTELIYIPLCFYFI